MAISHTETNKEKTDTLTDFFTTHQEAISYYLNKEYIEQLKKLLTKSNDAEEIQNIRSAMDALIKYQTALETLEYPSTLIKKYLKIRYSNLERIFSDPVKTKNFTRSLNQLTEILAHLHEYNTLAIPLKDSLPDLSVNVYQQGKKWLNPVYEIIKVLFLQDSLHVQVNDYENLVQLLKLATDAISFLKDEETNKSSIANILKYSFRMFKKWNIHEKLIYEFMMFAATIEIQDLILNSEQTVQLADVLDSSQWNNLEEYFGIIDPELINLLKNSVNLLTCCLIVLSKYTDIDFKSIVRIKYQRLADHIPRQEDIKDFNHEMSYLIEIVMHLHEFKRLLTSQNNTLFPELKDVYQEFFVIVNTRCSSIPYIDQDSSEELIHYISYIPVTLQDASNGECKI